MARVSFFQEQDNLSPSFRGIRCWEFASTKDNMLEVCLDEGQHAGTLPGRGTTCWELACRMDNML